MGYLKSLFVSSLLAIAVVANAEVKSSDMLMKEAFARAKAEKKTVLMSFHASWCGWCHKFDDFLKQPEIKKIWDSRIVMVWITALESPEKKSDENPGWESWMKKVGGENQGIPYMAFFDGNGKMKLTSNRTADKANAKDKGGNIGYPAAPEEIAWFMKMLKESAPNVTESERKTIEDSLKAVAKEIGR